MTRPLRLYAHRGAPLELPENTMPAFRRALELGADALEMDVHLTRDGHVVVSHDPTALRLGNVAARWRDLDLDEARRIDLGWGFVGADGGRPFAGAGIRVPTLEEVLVEFSGVTLNVDLKQFWPSMVGDVLTLLRRLGAEERVILASFHFVALAAMRARGFRGETALAPPEVAALLTVPRAILTHAPSFGTCAQIPERAGPIHVTRPAIIDKCHSLGMRVDVWTVNQPHDALRLLDLGVDGIMTDDVRAIAPVFRARRESTPRAH